MEPYAAKLSDTGIKPQSTCTSAVITKACTALITLLLMAGAIGGGLYLTRNQDEEYYTGGYKGAPLI
jgi:hypothetical protein